MKINGCNIYYKIDLEPYKKLDSISVELENIMIERYANYPYRATFASFLEIVNGNVVKRVFAINKRNGVYECARVVQNSSDCLIRSVDFTPMYGFKCSFAKGDIWMDKWDCYPDSCDMNTYKKYDFEYYKYYKSFEGGFLINMDFISAIRIEPRIEQMVKCGIHDYNQLKKVNFNGKNFLQKFKCKHDTYDKSASLLINQIAYKNKVSVHDYNQLKALAREIKVSLSTLRFYPNFFMYYKNLKDKQMYRDYINDCLFLEKDTTDKYWLMPNDENIAKRHTVMTAEINQINLLKMEAYDKRQIEERKILMEKREKEINDTLVGFKKSLKKLNSINNMTYKNIIYLVPKNANEVIAEGKALTHCVGNFGHGYIKRHADQTKFIIFARDITKPQEPLETIEFDLKNKKILQIRGNRNINSIHHEIIKKGMNELLATQNKEIAK